MKKVEKTESIGKPYYDDNEKRWKDSAGNTSFTKQDAKHAIESEINAREGRGINTLRPVDGFAMLVALFGLLCLGWIAVHGLYRQPFLAIGCAAGFVFGVYLFFKFFMHTMPSFRTKIYLWLVAITLVANFLLSRYFDFKLL
ncbi:hypothetical protein [Pseudomonas sp. RL_105y_Pfl1_103]|uniref:hypothetical protein n=1 Tax=Pseudomonas sp. RL_105y_Pfl1_103 TaxID=3088707 RepID=UPI0030D89C52